MICTHVSREKKAILFAAHDEQLEPEDSGWQFSCGRHGHSDDQLKVWLLSEVVDLDPTVRSVLDAEVGTAFQRDSMRQPWRVASLEESA